MNRETIIQIAREAGLAEVTDTNQNLRRAEQALLKRYAELVNSGDAGNWYQEAELEVIAARQALALPRRVYAMENWCEDKQKATRRAIVRAAAEIGIEQGNQMSTNTEQLKPCPFCGGEASFDHDDNGWNWITCTNCGASTNARASTMDDCRPLLAEAWNRRTPTGATHE